MDKCLLLALKMIALFTGSACILVTPSAIPQQELRICLPLGYRSRYLIRWYFSRIRSIALHYVMVIWLKRDQLPNTGRLQGRSIVTLPTKCGTHCHWKMVSRLQHPRWINWLDYRWGISIWRRLILSQPLLLLTPNKVIARLDNNGRIRLRVHF